MLNFDPYHLPSGRIFKTVHFMNSNIEIDPLDSLFHKLFFNIFLGQPHSSVHYYIARYFPHMTDPEPITWTIMPGSSDTGDFEEPQKTEHNILFNKHPFLDSNIMEGKLVLNSLESENYFPRVSAAELWLMFDSKEQAVETWRELLTKFETVSRTKKEIIQTDMKVIIYSKEASIGWPDCYELILFENLPEIKYKIKFHIGSDFLSKDMNHEISKL